MGKKNYQTISMQRNLLPMLTTNLNKTFTITLSKISQNYDQQKLPEKINRSYLRGRNHDYKIEQGNKP